jgi:hypothetical protein
MLFSYIYDLSYKHIFVKGPDGSMS